MNLKNKTNEYAAALGSSLDATPKAVLAAVTVSLLSCGGDNMEGVENALMLEWWQLYRAGIVPQKPPGQELHPKI